jgi:hypothetical protein
MPSATADLKLAKPRPSFPSLSPKKNKRTSELRENPASRGTETKRVVQYYLGRK